MKLKFEVGVLLFEWKSSSKNQWDWKHDQHQVGDNVQNTSSEEMSLALSTAWSWVWYHLPVVVERLTFSENTDDSCEVSRRKNNVQVSQQSLMEISPDLFCQGSQKHANTVLDSPQTCLVSTILGVLGWVTYYVAYMIRDARTRRLPMILRRTSSPVSASTVVLFVP